MKPGFTVQKRNLVPLFLPLAIGESGCRLSDRRIFMAENDQEEVELRSAEPIKMSGRPSPFLQAVRAPQDGEADWEYGRITEAQPVEGIFPVVGGYVDRAGKFHNMVHLRATSGEEEDIWSDMSLPFCVRMNEVLVRCVKRYGDITNPGEIRQAVLGSSQGTRLDMLLYLRCFSNYEDKGWIYKMDVECGSIICTMAESAPFSVDVNLYDVGRYDSPHPEQSEYEVVLPRIKVPVRWRRMTPAGDQIVEAVAAREESRKDVATWGVVVRLLDYDGKDVSVGLDDVLDKTGRVILGYGGRRSKMKPRGVEAYKLVKKMATYDRDFLREQFMDSEPSLDLEVSAKCPECGMVNRVRLDLNQSGFFFPKATSALTKRTFSSLWTVGG